MSVRILHGDCLEMIRTLPEASVHCCVTSPPYFGLRDYGVEGQIGLEPTPDEFVAKLVAVFREVRRVLRDDGTLWLNLGDSYAGYWGDAKAKAEGRASSADTNGWTNGFNMNARPQFDNLRRSGLKPKDLIGIPWRVAFALQQPYYTGTIRDERDRIWLAAMLDAEGCMFIHKRKAGQNNGQGYQRQNDSYGPGVEISNTSLPVIERIMALVGKGSICSQSPEQNGRRRQTIYRWNLRTIECREFVQELYPHLVAKQHQARILIGCPSSGERAEAAHAALIGLHRGIETDVDFAEPPSMFEPGWYLRQDLIWKKPNPMPESVRDRCTKAHEYIFLMAKSERYYFDADAIAEDVADGDRPQRRRALELAQQGGLTQAHIDAIGAAGVTDTGKALATQNGAGRNTEEVMRLAAEAKRVLGGYYREFLTKRSGNVERKPASARGVPVDTDGKSAGAVAGSVPWEGTTRNKRSVWTVTTQPFKEAHFATFPPALIEPCVLAGCPRGGVVLDPFGGAGTTGLVADRHGRDAVLIELNPEYADMAERRIRADAPLFAEVA